MAAIPRQPMLALFPLWLAIAAILVGWGLLLLWVFRRLAGAAFRGGLSMFQMLWLGYAGLLAFLQVCSFALPIAGLVLALSCVPALAGWTLQRRAVLRWLRTRRAAPARELGVVAAVIALASFACAWTASNAINWYDTGLYHLQAVKWFSTYPVVPGLANLHLRLGYNNSVHVFGAYVDTFWEGAATHVMNGFLMAALLSQWCVEILTARTPRGRLRQVFCLLSLPFFIAKLWTIEMASLSSDLALAVFCSVLVLELVSLPRGPRERLVVPVTLVAALGAVALTTKLGGGALFAVACVIVIVVLRRGATWRVRLVVFGVPALLVLGWMIRGVVLSGWLVFPVFGRIGLPWAVRPKVALAHLLEIESWGRVPRRPTEETLGHGFWFWFVCWFEVFRTSREITLFIAAGVGFAWRLASGPARSAARLLGEWGAIAACALGLVQWFYGAPDLRYGGFLFWLLAAVVFAPMLAPAMREATMRALVVAMSVVLLYWSGGTSVQLGMIPPAVGRLPDPPVPVTRRVSCGPETMIWQPADAQCWDAPLPCSPYTSIMTLRDPDSLASGFLPGPPRWPR